MSSFTGSQWWRHVLALETEKISVLSFHAVSRVTCVYIYIFDKYLTVKPWGEKRVTMHKTPQEKNYRNVCEVNNLVWVYIPVGVRICVNVRILVWVHVMSVFPQDIDFFFFYTSSPASVASCKVLDQTDSHRAWFTLQQIIIYQYIWLR